MNNARTHTEREKEKKEKAQEEMNNFNPDKLPSWWRGYTGNTKALCEKELHVPVRMDLPDNTYEIFCQNCTTDMTLEEHEKFFKNAR